MSKTTLAKQIANKLVSDGFISLDIIDDVISCITHTLSNKKIKKKRGKTAYNTYVAENRDIIKKMLGDDNKVRGAFITKAGEMWKSLNEEEKAHYQTLANKLNGTSEAEILTKKTQKTQKTIKSNDNHTSDSLIGPLNNTIAFGKVSGTRSFKTFEKALEKMNSKPEAAVIIRMSNGKFRLMSAIINTEKAEETEHYPFIYKNDDTTTWVRKIVIDHYNSYGPFTHTNPFNANKTNDTHVSDTPKVNKTNTQLNEEVEPEYKAMYIDNVRYWVFTNCGKYVLSYDKSKYPSCDDYIGKCFINNKLVDAGPLPSSIKTFLE
tara:strand:- start:2561 stop:3520 length:960 start_codon:yes stop_codon:yes gene_type:complete